MKKQAFVLLVILAMIASSCTVSKTVSSARQMTPKTQVMVADLEVGTIKVTGEFKYDTKKNQIVDTKELVENAIYNALQPANADVLVAPITQVVQDTRGRKYYTVTVTGYPAYYRNFRHVAIKDIELKEINGTVYVIPRNIDNTPAGYQVVVPTDKYANYIDMNLMSLDKVVFDSANGQCSGTGEVVESSASIKEEKGIKGMLNKMMDKTAKNKKKK